MNEDNEINEDNEDNEINEDNKLIDYQIKDIIKSINH